MFVLKSTNKTLESVFCDMENCITNYNDLSVRCNSKWIDLNSVTLSDIYSANVVITSNRSDNTYESFDCNYGEITFSLFSYESGNVIKDYSVKFDEETGEIDSEYEWNNDYDGGYGNFNYLPKDVKTIVRLLVIAFINEVEQEKIEEYEAFKEEVKENYLNPLSLSKLINSARYALKDRSSGSKRIVRASGIYYSLSQTFRNNPYGKLSRRIVIRCLNNRSKIIFIYQEPIIKTGHESEDKPLISLICNDTVLRSFNIEDPEKVILENLIYLPWFTDYAVLDCLGYSAEDKAYFRGIADNGFGLLFNTFKKDN